MKYAKRRWVGEEALGGGLGGGAGSGAVAPRQQGLTLVHFSAQLEPCLTQADTLQTLNPLTPPLHGLHNPHAHPLSHTKRSS